MRRPTTKTETLEEKVARLVNEHPMIVRIREQAAGWSDPTARQVADSATCAPSKPQPKRPTEAAEYQLLVQAGGLYGVKASAIPDFVARVRSEMPRTESRLDPTGPVGLAEYVQTLRARAPHLFAVRGNGGTA